MIYRLGRAGESRFDITSLSMVNTGSEFSCKGILGIILGGSPHGVSSTSDWINKESSF